MARDERTFTLFYHFKSSGVLEKHFYHKGDLYSAAELAKKHCKKMGLFYIKVRSFIVDLEDQELRREIQEYSETEPL